MEFWLNIQVVAIFKIRTTQAKLQFCQVVTDQVAGHFAAYQNFIQINREICKKIILGVLTFSYINNKGQGYSN